MQRGLKWVKLLKGSKNIFFIRGVDRKQKDDDA
jgi:hypothetical protein